MSKQQDIITEGEARVASDKLQILVDSLEQVLFGQSSLIHGVVVAVLAGGHVLLEGLPGLGKTELVKGLGQAVSLEVKRVQFTPDLLPGDISGTPVLEEQNGSRRFVFQAGPVFTNLLLADEINRASPKTQSALLEAMQEHSVTVMGETHALPRPFFVLATQNPIELEGTYPLPEAQLDRFLFKLTVGRNSAEVLETIVLNRELGVQPEVKACLSREQLLELQAQVRRVYLPPIVANYIARLVDATHQTEGVVKYGASPRAAIALAAASRARALVTGRINASFEDVKLLATSVLQHRVVLDYQAKLDGKSSESVVNEILASVPFDATPLPRNLQTST